MIATLLACAWQTIPQHEATTPTSRLNEPAWAARHALKVEESRTRAKLCFLGDSIFQRWETVSPESWMSWNAVNFGFNGDRTQHALWRLSNGELLGSRPDLVIVLIGTNNLAHGPTGPSHAADGIKLLVRTIRQGSPRSKFLLLTLIPRGKLASDPIRRESEFLSKSILSMSDGVNVFAVDIQRIFLNADGSLRQDRLMPDFVHPNDSGYTALRNALASKVRQLLDL